MRDFSLLHNGQTGCGAGPVLYIMDTGALSSSFKRQKREAGHSSLSSAEVKNGGAIPPLVHTFLRYGAYLIK
jgi:hypothetical protein